MADPAKDAHDGTLRAIIHAACAHANARANNTLHILLGHAFRTVMRQGVGHLMPHHDGQSVLILRHRDQARIDGRITPRQRKRIDLRAVDDVERPFKTGIFGRGGAGDPRPDFAHRIHDRSGGDQVLAIVL